MSSTLIALGIDRMTTGERIALVQEILDTVAAEQPRPPLPAHVQVMLGERLADMKENPDDCVIYEAK